MVFLTIAIVVVSPCKGEVIVFDGAVKIFLLFTPLGKQNSIVNPPKMYCNENNLLLSKKEITNPNLSFQNSKENCLLLTEGLIASALDKLLYLVCLFVFRIKMVLNV